MADQWLWSCPLDRWLIALAQGWHLSLAPLVPSYEGTGHARFAVLMFRNVEGK
jgi:hypothetical protein